MLIIRDMSVDDLKEVAMIEEQTFSMPWSEDAFEEMIQNPHAYYYVAQNENCIVGCCGMRNILGEGEITTVVIKEEYQNQGIGNTLMSYMIEAGIRLGVEAFLLEVRKSNMQAIKLYQNLGFAVEGVRKNFYEKPIEDGLIMWKRIKTDQ